MGDEISVTPGKQTENWFTVATEKAGKSADAKIPYLLYTPKGYQAGNKQPLLLFLHGYGESGDGDFQQLKIHGPAKLADGKDFPFVIVSPQCPKPPADMAKIIAAWDEDQLVQLLDHVAKHASIDLNRVYVSGLSMGGFGTWRLVAKHPDRFAAAIPVCGGGRIEWADELKSVPIWAFHGALDNVVRLSHSKSMVDAVQEVGGDVKLTIYPKAEHDSWTATYDNPKIYQWLLRQKRTTDN